MSEEESALIETINRLRLSVDALHKTLESDYPTRVEISARRRNVVMGTLAAIVLSYFLTISTVSYCFLDGIPARGEKQFCHIFPGYEQSFDNNRSSIDARAKLQERINQLEEKVKSLQP
jgi:hypothetical protein